MKGHYEFVIDSIGGDIDLTFNVKQFNVNRTANTSATWNDTGFIAMILSLDIEPMEKQKTQDARMAY
jgi:hypothetical protein